MLIQVISAFGYNALLKELFAKNPMQISGRITASTNPHSIGGMLGSMGGIEEERELLNKTKDTYAEKIRTSTDPSVVIEWLLDTVREIDNETAKWLKEEMSTRQILNGITTNSEIAESKNILLFSTKRF